MGPRFIVIPTPVLHEASGVRQTREPRLVETLVPQASIDARDDSVLAGLARVDQAQVDAVLDRPGVQHASGQRGTIIQDQFRRSFTLHDEAFQDGNNARSRQRTIDLDGERFPREEIPHAQQTQVATAHQRIAHEIQSPSRVGTTQQRGHATPFLPSPRAGSAAERQVFLPIESFNPLVIADDPLPAQQRVQSPVAEARSLRRQFPEAGAHPSRRVRSDPIPRGCSADAHDPAGAPFREGLVLL